MAVILDNSIVEGPSYQLRPINNVEVEKNIALLNGTPRIRKELKGTILSLLTGGVGNENFSIGCLTYYQDLEYVKILLIFRLDYFLLPNLEKKISS